MTWSFISGSMQINLLTHELIQNIRFQLILNTIQSKYNLDYKQFFKCNIPNLRILYARC